MEHSTILSERPGSTATSATAPSDRLTIDDAQVLVRRAARALSRHGLVHAYGHCSVRLDEHHFLVCAPKPLGTILPGETGSVVAIDGDLPPEVLDEVRIHREIYRRRPDVGGIVRSMPPHVMSLSVLRRTPRVLHGMGSYFAPRTPLWDDPLLVRDDDRAVKVAQAMGPAPALVMRGNGVVVAGLSLEETVVLTWYLEDAARIEIECQTFPEEPVGLTEQEIQVRRTRTGRIFERMWDYLTFGDPEPKGCSTTVRLNDLRRA